MYCLKRYDSIQLRRQYHSESRHTSQHVCLPLYTAPQLSDVVNSPLLSSADHDTLPPEADAPAGHSGHVTTGHDNDDDANNADYIKEVILEVTGQCVSWKMTYRISFANRRLTIFTVLFFDREKMKFDTTI